MLDTPFGFQENADDIAARTVAYFRDSVGRHVEVASFRDAPTATPLEYERMCALVAQAGWVFAGPGSPTYAIRQWSGTRVPDLLAEKLTTGGVVVFSSAAAVGLGEVALPVYEIYKVGAAPRLGRRASTWCAAAGLRAAVIPHYNNAEGGTHDTRFCYMGERRLRVLEEALARRLRHPRRRRAHRVHHRRRERDAHRSRPRSGHLAARRARRRHWQAPGGGAARGADLGGGARCRTVAAVAVRQRAAGGRTRCRRPLHGAR